MKHYNNEHQEQLFLDFLAEQKLELSEETLDKLYKYAECVIQGNELQNLISKNDATKFLSRHIADSIMPFCKLRNTLEMNAGKRWADMGAGGGCPVFPLAILMPEVKFYAVEPRNKRVQFLQQAKEQLGLDNLEVVGKRFETAELINLDFISCRALSTFENDWERAKFNLKSTGYFITLKSFETIAHLQADPQVNICKYNLPEEERQYAIVYRKR